MKKHIIILMIFAICFGGGLLFAQDFQLIYNDGTVELQKGGGWSILYAGDMVPENSVIRVGRGGIAEFSNPGTTLLFSKPGTYRLESQAGQNRNEQVAAVSSVFGRIARMGGDGERGQSQAMGVRGSEAVEDIGFEWVEEDSMSYDEALSAFQSQDYVLAADILENEVDPLALDDESAYWYYLAASYYESGKKGPALHTARSHDPDAYSEVYAEFLLLKGRLALESMDFEGAAQQFEKYTESANSPARKQMGNYLFGYALVQMGESTRARNVLQEAVRIDADSEVTALARELLQ